MTPRVVVAGERAPTRAGLRLALERGGFAVCAQATDAREVVAASLRTSAELVVLPTDLPGDALRAVEELTRALPAAHVVVLTARPNEDELVAAVLAGASGYLDEGVSAERLPHVLRAVLRGEAALPRHLSGRLLTEVRARHRRRGVLPARLRARLTEREWDMVEHLREGRGTAEIARLLRISEVTVRRHISTLLAKLGVRDRSSAVALIREAAHDRRSED